MHRELTADMKSPASVQVVCPSCEEMSFTRVDRSGEPGTDEPAARGKEPEGASSWRCPHCHARPPDSGPRPVGGRPVTKCWICGTDEFYVQKDFNRQLGAFLVLLSAGLIFLVMLVNHRLGIALLMGVALADWVVYRLVRNVTVCYLCHSLYRGFPQHAEHTGFYLGNEEKYKKLRKKWIERCVRAPLVR